MYEQSVTKSPMSSALLGLVAALSWGVNDFLARFPARTVGPIRTVLAITFAGLTFLSRPGSS
jgi:hypothetical protein